LPQFYSQPKQNVDLSVLVGNLGRNTILFYLSFIYLGCRTDAK